MSITQGSKMSSEILDQQAEIGALYPFHVSISIDSCEDLAIHDLTTSDPYVSLKCNDKRIGKTSTIQR